MSQTLAIFHEAYRGLRARKMFWIVLFLSLFVVLVFACVGVNENGLTLLVWDLHFGPTTNEFPPAMLYKTMFVSLGIGIWLTWIAAILALISTAGIFPNFIAKGAIDLVIRFHNRYYIIDWKSNFLGMHHRDYRPDRLQQVMVRDFYILQYHLYTLALHQYLALRVPGYRYETCFGGVYYGFLRGVDTGRGVQSGIYSDRPPPALIEELRTQLLAPAGSGIRTL